MKKIVKMMVDGFSVRRIPAYIAYALVVVCVIGCFTAGKHCLFTGGAMYIIGMILDPKSDLYRDK